MKEPRPTVAPTRERILDAAIAAIEAGGEASLRVDAIAETAAITKPSIYHFFGDRDGLVAAAQAERYRRSALSGVDEVTAAAKAATTREEFVAVLERVVDIAMEPAGNDRRAARVQMFGSAVSRPELTERMVTTLKETMAHYDEFIAVPFDRGWTRTKLDVDTIALWWMSVTFGRHLWDLAADRRLNRQWKELVLAQLQVAFFGED